MEKTNIALIQMDIHFGQPDKNYVQAGQLIEEAAHKGAGLILLPELWTTGYDLERATEIGDENGIATQTFLSKLAKNFQVIIVGGSILELSEGKVYNTTYVADQDGEIQAVYRKLHLFRLMEEEKYLQAGENTSSFMIGETKVGLAICYDLRFPELIRKYALSECKLLVLPAEWPHPRLHHWRTLLQARAIENQMYVVACNRVGRVGETEFFGHSMVVDPWGEIIVEGSEREEILYAEVDLTLVDEIRKRIPVFTDRRADIY